MLGHRILSLKLLMQVVPKATAKQGDVSFVSGAAE